MREVTINNGIPYGVFGIPLNSEELCGNKNQSLTLHLTEYMDDDCTQIPFNQELFTHTKEPIKTKGILKKVNDEWVVKQYIFKCDKCGGIKLWSGRNLGGHSGVEYWDFICNSCCSKIELDLTATELKKHTTHIFCQDITVTDEENRITIDIDVQANKWLFSKKDYGKSIEVVGFLDTAKDSDTRLIMTSPIVRLAEIPEDVDSVYESDNRSDVSPEWRKEVLARDKHCVICGGEKHLEAHHIFGYKGYPQLRDNVDNGITLCQFCHGNYHSQYGVKNPNPVSFVQFIRKFR